MVIKVEGVEASHSEAVQAPQEAAGAPLSASAFWMPLYRVKALELALQGSYANFQPEQVVERASVFEAYILQGAPPLPEQLPTVEEQISAAFVNLTGSLDGNRV